MEGMRLTRNGKNALAMALENKPLHFTKIVLGSGDFAADSVLDLTALVKPVIALPLTAILNEGNGVVTLKAILNTAQILEGFFAKEIGVFAINPDTGAEILYSYCNTGDESSYIPSNIGPVSKNLRIGIKTVIDDAQNISADLNADFAYISEEEFAAHLNAAHPHLNAPNHYLDVDEADAIWATDNDSHLHKLALKDLKAMLADKAALSPSRDELFLKAKQDLGLEANVIMYEDFEGEKTYDALNVKVTSSAMGGKLIGLESYEGVRAGGVYTISDGIFREPVTIKAVRKNAGGTHAELVRGLDFSYDNNATFLLRSFEKGSEQLNVIFNPVGFAGYEANVERRIEMSRYEQDYTFKGGMLTADGYLTL